MGLNKVYTVWTRSDKVNWTFGDKEAQALDFKEMVKESGDHATLCYYENGKLMAMSGDDCWQAPTTLKTAVMA